LHRICSTSVKKLPGSCRTEGLVNPSMSRRALNARWYSPLLRFRAGWPRVSNSRRGYPNSAGWRSRLRLDLCPAILAAREAPALGCAGLKRLARGRKFVGTVVQFERPPGERTTASHCASTPAPHGTLGIDAARIEQAMSKYEVALVCVQKLLRSVDALEKSELVLFEPGNREALERLVTSVRLRLPSGLAKLADSLLALRAAVEHASRISNSPERIMAKADHAEA
jgi:hypothetical protein